MEISDRFGELVRPRGWCLVSLDIIEAVVTAVQDDGIGTLKYDPGSAALIRRDR